MRRTNLISLRRYSMPKRERDSRAGHSLERARTARDQQSWLTESGPSPTINHTVQYYNMAGLLVVLQVLVILGLLTPSEGTIVYKLPQATANGGSTYTYNFPETVDLTDARIILFKASTNETNVSYAITGGDTGKFELKGVSNTVTTGAAASLISNDSADSEVSLQFKSTGFTNTALRRDTNPAEASVSVEVTVTDGADSDVITINVTFENVNDEDIVLGTVTEAVGNTTTTSTVINETTFAVTTKLYDIRLTDADFDDTVSNLTISIHPDYNSNFSANCSIGVTYDNWDCALFVQAGVVFDYEKQTGYRIQATISDKISSAEVSFTIGVGNVPDETPEFEPGNMPTSIQLAETINGVTLTQQETIFQVKGVNKDYDYRTSDLSYSVPNITNLAGETLFVIDNVTGVIERTTNELSYEDLDPNSPFITIQVTVKLTATPTLNFTQNLTINVTNECEAPTFVTTAQPTFTFDEGSGQTVGSDFHVTGGSNKSPSNPGSSTYNIRVRDPDAPTNGNSISPGHGELIIYSIAPGGNHDLFQLDCSAKGGQNATAYTLNTNTGATTANCQIDWEKVPDYEALAEKPVFTLTIIATDSCGASAEVTMTIAIRNVNDLVPVFVNTGTYDTTISELSRRGTYITTVTAYDPDDDPHPTITYTLDTNNGSPTSALSDPGTYWFYLITRTVNAKLTSQVADLYVNYPWDRDSIADTVGVTISAADSTPTTTYVRNGVSSNSITVTVTFSDANDNRPTIETFWNRELPYNEAQGYDMGVKISTNTNSTPLNDRGVNNQFAYELLAPTNYFDLNSTAGSLAKTSEIMAPLERYDVFLISHDLGTDPSRLYSPLGIVRVDSYIAEEVQIKIIMSITDVYFASNKNRFVAALNGIFLHPWYFRVYKYTYDSGSSRTTATIYALTSDATEYVENTNRTKTYVIASELLSVTRANADGTPTTTITNSAGGVLDDYNVVLVEPLVPETTEDKNWWLDEEAGIATICAIITVGIILLAALAFLIYLLVTMERTPPPPALPKPVEPKVEPLKQDYRKSGPGPQLLEDEDEEIVSRPVPKKGAQMRGHDAVTDRDYEVDPVTGQRHWVNDEGDRM